MMIYGSVCSGIEAATVAWHSLGWRPAWFCEFDKFPSKVLKHHYPEIPNLDDMTTIEKRPEYEQPIDLLVGGTPCQSFSIAGLRKGLDDDRGNLALKFCRILKEKQPRWFVWENVPGVLSSNKGRDFAAILSAFSECGYGFAYRILDAQYFGVPQRRRRVFVVGHLGDWRHAAAVLFERESLRGYPTPCSKKRKVVAALTANGVGTCGPDDNQGQADHLIAHTLRGDVFDASEDGTGRGTPIIPIAFSAKDHGADACEDLSPTLRAGGYDKSHANSGNWMAIAFAQNQIGEVRTGKVFNTLNTNSNASGRNTPMVTYPINTQIALRHEALGEGTGMGIGSEDDPAFTLQANHCHAIRQAHAVRRLTPRECERLQGFPDDYTLIPMGKKMAADGPRYKALGNSMAVPVMRWIGQRIQMVENIKLI